MKKNRRNERKAYFQQADQAPMDPNTDNNPEKLGYPGEVGYKNAPMAVPVGEDSRPWEQRWFEGAAAKTKQVMGPKGAEFELKKEWLRILPDAKVANAALTGGFTRTAKPQDSFWTFYMKGAGGSKKPILRATLADIWGKQLSEDLATKTASKAYATEVFKKIREEGFNTVAYLLTGEKKFAQAANGGKGLRKVAQVSYDDDLSMGGEEDADLGVALDAEVENTAAEGEVTVELLSSKHEELETAQTELVENTAPESTADVFVQLQDAERMIDEAKDEMEGAVAALRDKTRTAASKVKLIRVVAEAQDDAVSTLSASDSIIKKAQFAVEEIAEEAPAGDMGEEVVVDDLGSEDLGGDIGDGDMGGAAIEAADAAIEAASELSGGEEAIDDLGAESVDVDVEAVDGDMGEEVSIDDALASGKGAKTAVAKFLKARSAKRRAVAMGDDNSAEQGKYQVVPDGAPKDGDAEIAAAHPNGGSDVTNLTAGGAPKDNGQRFETVVEAQDVDLAVANKMPSGNLNGQAGDPNSDVGGSATASSKRRVKTASNEIPGGVDQETKDFWAKDLWGDAEGDSAAKEFGKLMYQDFGTARASIKAAVSEGVAKEVKAAAEEAEAKTERAYALADLAVEKGFVEKTVEARGDFVKEVKAFNDEAFLSLKKRLEASASRGGGMIATASAKKIPNVGLLDGSEVSSSKDEFSALDSFGWK